MVSSASKSTPVSEAGFVNSTAEINPVGSHLDLVCRDHKENTRAGYCTVQYSRRGPPVVYKIASCINCGNPSPRGDLTGRDTNQERKECTCPTCILRESAATKGYMGLNKDVYS